VRTLVLFPLRVHRQVDLDARGLSRTREFIRVLDKEVGRGATVDLLYKSQMDLDTVTGGKAVPGILCGCCGHRFSS
jgi:hypothetical protein